MGREGRGGGGILIGPDDSWHGIVQKCALYVVLLNLGDESSFCQELVYLICF